MGHCHSEKLGHCFIVQISLFCYFTILLSCFFVYCWCIVSYPLKFTCSWLDEIKVIDLKFLGWNDYHPIIRESFRWYLLFFLPHYLLMSLVICTQSLCCFLTLRCMEWGGGRWTPVPFRQQIPENSWFFKTFCCRCPYEKKYSFTPSQSTLKYGSEN